ncbi:hypothetical protein F5X96DRAFT_643329 [Biscogniauxia mediterranea]|nr:hypothetical protein F5X96DRAFT_643329 [Biscogniauxia mediterranea]
MPSPRPELRKRRYQARSRSGCITCKAKHVRCDEKKPLCTNCLVKGGKCGYAEPSPTAIEKSRTAHGTGTPWLRGRASSSPDCDPNYFFVDYPIAMTHESLVLFRIFTQHRSVVDEDTDQPVNDFVIHRALSNPALLHFVLLLSSIRWTWDTGSMQRIRRSYLHHKLEAIKFVNEQLEDSRTALADSTVASIVGLALAESALGNRDTAMAHMSGLAKIAQMRDVDAAASGNTFPGLMILRSIGASETSINELLNVLRGGVEDRKSPNSLCRHRAAGNRFNGDTKTCAMSAVHGVPEPSAQREAIGELGSRVPPTVSESRSRLMSCYLLVFVILGTDSIDPFIVNWLVEWMLSDLYYEVEALRRGELPRQLWFWGAMKSMCAVMAARATSDLEARQIDKWRVLCREKIRLVSHTLSLKDWEHVKEMFAGLAWRDEFADEHQVREMWEEAVSGECVVTMPTVTPSYVDRYDFMSVEEREGSISMLEISNNMTMRM